MTNNMEEAGDSIEDIMKVMSECCKDEYTFPSRLCMIPEYYNYKFCNHPKPLIKLIEEARKKGEKLRLWWLE